MAYSGEAIVGHWAWGDVVFDLDSMTLPDRLPALVDHDRGQRAGVIDQFQIDSENGLTVSGYLLDNESGRSVAADADAGFPWQMSESCKVSKATCSGRAVFSTGPCGMGRA